jgi:hypothetical protein
MQRIEGVSACLRADPVQLRSYPASLSIVPCTARLHWQSAPQTTYVTGQYVMTLKGCFAPAGTPSTPDYGS